MKILLVDDQAILMDGIANLLSKSAYEVVEKANSIEDALKYFNETEFDILIADYNIIDDNGLILIRKVKQVYPNLKLIVLSMHDETHLAEEILKDEINGHVINKNAHHDLVEALNQIEKGKIQISDEINRIINHALEPKLDVIKLTEKENAVLQLIANNFSKKDIGEEMSISDRSVNTLCRNLFKKTKTTSIVGLLKYAYANNLV
jgi:two-component system nitrate/nitrite response regulator NarL